jgi:Tol biopolymer transport system component
VFDLARGVPTQFTFDPKGSDNPTWSPDGSRIAFYSDRTGHNVIYSRLSNGAGREEMLMDSEKTNAYLEEWSRDGKYIVYRLSRQGLWAIPVSGDRKPFSLLNNTDAQQAAISPDGRWVAYRANDSSKSEVFIQSFAPFGGRWRVSGAGGSQPSWRADGKELFYLNRTKMMSVDIKVSGSGIDAGIPRELFDLPTIAQDNARNSYVGTSDGKRFLCLTKADTGDTTQLTLVLNWTAGLKK